MEKKEALEYLESITQAVEASNRIFLSSSQMFVFGAMVLLVPLIEFGFSRLCAFFAIIKHPFASVVIHLLFYLILFMAAYFIFLREKDSPKNTNPAVRKSLRIFRPIVVSIFGFIIILSTIGQDALVCPVILILFGVLYNMLGQFSIKTIRFVSWTYILLGFILAYMSQYKIPSLWIVFTTYVGITYIIMGYSLKRNA